MEQKKQFGQEFINEYKKEFWLGDESDTLNNVEFLLYAACRDALEQKKEVERLQGYVERLIDSRV